MPLIAVWTSNPSAVGEFSIEQIVATAGDGNLKDDSDCSQELRAYLAQVSSRKLVDYAEHCLSLTFSKSGMVLQDLVNEFGRRLDYSVINGRYQGASNKIGFDGIWVSPEGHTMVVEVKTTDVYRISLGTIISYRDKLMANKQVNGKPSTLIIVGREDTGELEAQVRGSRHAWDIRLISADALAKLVQLKENAEGPETGRKIRSLLVPMEYTRLDEMVDVMFTAATDIEVAIVSDEQDEGADVNGKPKGIWQFTNSAVLDHKREDIIAALGRAVGTNLIKKSRALFWDSDHQKRVACTISKRYTRSYPYWYAYHPQWDEFLRNGDLSFLVVGCMDLSIAFAIPWKTFNPLLEALNTTTTDRGTYWHLHLTEIEKGTYGLLLPKRGQTLPLNEFRLPLTGSETK